MKECTRVNKVDFISFNAMFPSCEVCRVYRGLYVFLHSGLYIGNVMDMLS